MKKKLKKFLEIKRYDYQNFLYEEPSVPFQREEDLKIKELLDFINDNYYTFLPTPPKGKSLYFLRKIVFKWLFKYSFRQVIFNDKVRSLMNLIVSKLQDLEYYSGRFYGIGKQDYEFKKENIDLLQEVKEIKNLCTKLQIENNKLKEKNKQLETVLQQLQSLTTSYNARVYALEELFELQQKDGSAPSQHRFFSQYGEDIWIVNNLKLPKKGFFVDVGAGDGITFSNTYLFEKKGWDGICIEPHPLSYRKAKRIRKKVLNIAISNKEGEMDFYLSNISPDWSGLRPTKNYSKVIKVKTKKLETVLKENKVSRIDLISIDVEGTEMEVWHSFDWRKYKPAIVIIEYNTQGKINKEILRYFTSISYTLVHKTEANYIFVLDPKLLRK